ncbi:MAG TPA: BON domain-containing protein [Candidatus Dormibacteraeota bacterium]|nr:BON domain-containing protein [Candidatus Dormibacteraeota bacterium]
MRRILPLACCAVVMATAAAATEPDNTAVNARDRNSASVTVFDQGGSEADRTITAEIRSRVVKDDSLSTNAHNVKIITDKGMVTLRGPVDSVHEKAAVEAKAKGVPGVKEVTSQLEVTRASSK